MTIIEIKSLENGGHRNATGNFEIVPDGFAVIPAHMETQGFPFGEVAAEEIGGVMTVTKWTAGTIPEVEEAEHPIGEFEQLRADIEFVALMTGVEL